MGNCVGVSKGAASCLRQRSGAEARVCKQATTSVEPVPSDDPAVSRGPGDDGNASSSSSSSGSGRSGRSGSSSSSSTPANDTLRHRASGSAYSLPLSCYVLRRTQDVTDRYTIAEQIGFGQYGVVRAATDKITGLKYAIKSISKTRALQDRHDYCQRIRTEVEILYHLGGHANIVQLYDVFEDATTIHLIMELCEGGDWFDQLLSGGAFTEAQAARAVQSVLQTLTFCHSLGVAHRDIKPENLLYTARHPNAAIKLADFGLSAMISTADAADNAVGMTGSGQVVRKVVGSAIYMAPEALTSYGANKERDIWSLGVVLFITLSGYPPFDGNEIQEVFDAILSQPLRFEDPSWHHISADAKHFIGRMLCKDPKRRASISELLSHPWMQPARGDASPGGLGQEKATRQPVLPDTVVSRLHQFAGMNRFKKEARKVVSSFLPKEEVAGLRHIFQDMDADGDGLITLAELRSVLASRRLILTDAQSQHMLECADLNLNGVIDHEEFLAATIHDMHLAKDELMLKAFKHFDRDGSGFITRSDLRAALALVPEIDLDSIMQDIDKDGDSLINYEEFCRCLRDKDQSLDASPSLWPLLSASLSIRRSMLSSHSLRSRASLASNSLMTSTSGKRRHPRTVHFKESFKNSLQSVREYPPGTKPVSHLSTTGPGLMPSSDAAGECGDAPATSSGPRLAAGGGSGVCLLLLAPGGGAARGGDAAAAPRGEIEARVSSRRGSALMKSIMMDDQQMQGIMSRLASLRRSGTDRDRAAPTTPARQQPGPLGLLVRDASCTPLRQGQGGGGDASKLRPRSGRASASGVVLAASPAAVAAVSQASVSPLRAQGPAPVQVTPWPPSARSGRAGCRPHPSPGSSHPSPSTSHADPSPSHLKPGSSRPSPSPTYPSPGPSRRKTSSSHPSPRTSRPTPSSSRPTPSIPASTHQPRSPELRPFSHSPHQRTQSQSSSTCSPAVARGVGPQPPSPRGRSPGARIRRSIYRSLGRSLSRSKPGRDGASRGSSRAVSRGSSRAMSRGSSRCSGRAGSRGRLSNGPSRCSSRGSLRALSRSSSRAVSRVPSCVSRDAGSMSSPSRAAPSLRGAKPGGGTSRAGSLRGHTASVVTFSRTNSRVQPVDCSRGDCSPSLPGTSSAANAARPRSHLHSSPDASLRLLSRMASSHKGRARNNSMRSLGASQSLMVSGSIGRPSSAMLASILTEWENELYPAASPSGARNGRND